MAIGEARRPGQAAAEACLASSRWRATGVQALDRLKFRILLIWCRLSEGCKQRRVPRMSMLPCGPAVAHHRAHGRAHLVSGGMQAGCTAFSAASSTLEARAAPKMAASMATRASIGCRRPRVRRWVKPS